MLRKKTEPKPSMPVRSFLTRAGTAHMNLDRTEVSFQNPGFLTCNGLTVALRRTFLSRRLSQPLLVIANFKKVPPSKGLEKLHDGNYKILTDLGVKSSKNDSVPMQDTHILLNTEAPSGVQNPSLIKSKSQETTQSWYKRVKHSQINIPTLSGPAAEILSCPLERTCCGKGLFSEETLNDTSGSPRLFAKGTVCAPLPQRTTAKVISQGNPRIQLEELG